MLTSEDKPYWAVVADVSVATGVSRRCVAAPRDPTSVHGFVVDQAFSPAMAAPPLLGLVRLLARLDPLGRAFCRRGRFRVSRAGGVAARPEIGVQKNPAFSRQRRERGGEANLTDFQRQVHLSSISGKLTFVRRDPSPNQARANSPPQLEALGRASRHLHDLNPLTRG